MVCWYSDCSVEYENGVGGQYEAEAQWSPEYLLKAPMWWGTEEITELMSSRLQAM